MVHMETTGDMCVSVTGAWKRYSPESPSVLRNLCMTVPQSSIYGLLGESGCGKTTLLKCIVGLQDLDFGDIRVWGKQAGTEESGIPGAKIGYMPQDMSVYPNLTLAETLYLFGSFHGMSSGVIKERTSFYAQFLDIPENKRLVGDFSGGQQRRVSFAVALFHNPQLLILDEPTVGVDPVLREAIWDHLFQLSKEGKTIIISTHYIEEVKRAHKVGFLRNGRLIAENSPSALLEAHETASLETVFLLEAQSDDNGIKCASLQNGLNSQQTKVRSDMCSPYNIRKLLSWNIIKTVVWKEIMRIRRHSIILLFMLIIPIFSFLLVNAALENNFPRTTFGIVNGEVPDDPLCKETLLSELDGCNITGLSCHFLHHLHHNAPVLEMVPFKDKEEANAGIRGGKISAALLISPTYSNNFKERITDGKRAANEVIDNSNIQIVRDGSNVYVEVTMYLMLLEAFQSFTSAVLEKCGLNPAITKLPMMYESVYGSFEQTASECAGIGLIVLILFALSMAYTGLTFLEEKHYCTLDRLWASGVTMFHFVAGYSIVQYLMTALQCIILISGMYLVGIPFAISPLWPALLLMTLPAMGIAIGSLITYQLRDEILASLIMFAVFFVCIVFSGATWPTEFLDTTIRTIARLLPCTAVVDSFRAMQSMGLGIDHPVVWLGFVSSPMWTVIVSGAFWLYVKLQKNRRN